MPTPQLALPQQFGRFLFAGALVFTLFFWGMSSILMSAQDTHRDFMAVRLLVKGCIAQPAACFQDVQSAYLPFYLHQHNLVACYLIAFAAAWLAAFLFDTKILRKENML